MCNLRSTLYYKGYMYAYMHVLYHLPVNTIVNNATMFYAPVGNNTDDTLSPTGSAALSVPSSLLVVQHMTPFLTPPSASTPVTNGIM